VKSENITDTEYLKEVIVDELFIIYVDNESLTDKINIQDNGPTVILMVGVNGVGKTTTIAKLAHKYVNDRKRF
jgi:fused signal recognition particle receptor